MTPMRFRIGLADHDGWIRLFLARGEPAGEVAFFLSEALHGWMQDNPQLWVRMIVPITSNGDTSELHAWCDRVPVPDARPDAGESQE